MTLLALAIFFFGVVAICCIVLGLAIQVWSTAAQQDSTEDCEDDDAVSVVSMSSDNDDATTMTMPLVISHRNAESDWEFPSPGGRHSRMLQVRKKQNCAKFH